VCVVARPPTFHEHLRVMPGLKQRPIQHLIAALPLEELYRFPVDCLVRYIPRPRSTAETDFT
jgi:hypothetical protein